MCGTGSVLPRRVSLWYCEVESRAGLVLRSAVALCLVKYQLCFAKSCTGVVEPGIVMHWLRMVKSRTASVMRLQGEVGCWLGKVI